MKFAPLAALLLLSATSGCAGYRPSGGECQPGYSEAALGAGSYRIRVEAAGRTTRAWLVRALERRAGQLCPVGFALAEVELDVGACMHRSPVEFSFATARATCTR